MRANMHKVRPGLYLVRTQAGFKKAVKTYVENCGIEWLAKSLEGFPTAYPSVVQFGYNEDAGQLYANCEPLNEYLGSLSALIDKIKQLDAQGTTDENPS